MAQLPKFNNSMKKLKPKQGHKLVWFTLILIAIPVVFVLYVLLVSSIGQNKPVVGNRFDNGNLEPKITQEQLDQVNSSVSSINGVDGATVDLKSATLRISLDTSDGASQEEVDAIAGAAYDAVDQVLPVSKYFTNKEKKKMYDLEVGAYNYLVDDSHPADGQIYTKITKTGAGEKTIDVLTTAKDPELVEQITR